MSNTDSGNILVAEHHGVHVIKMTGDVRLNFCVPFDSYIQSLFDQEGFYSILFDLTDVDGLDSTTLGLMAKLAVRSEQSRNIKPIIVGAKPGVERLLDMMGINEVCELVTMEAENYCSVSDFSPLNKVEDSDDEDVVRHKVLEAHCVLMGLNDENKATFKDLVKTLEQV